MTTQPMTDEQVTEVLKDAVHHLTNVAHILSTGNNPTEMETEDNRYAEARTHYTRPQNRLVEQLETVGKGKHR